MTTNTLNATTNTPLADLEAGINHYPNHTQDDRNKATDLIIDAGAETCYAIPSDRYIAFKNAEGAIVAYLHLHYITITTAADAMPARDEATGKATPEATHGGGGWDIHLSGYKAGNGGGAHRPLAYGDTCPRCFEERGLNGACGNCD